MRQDILAKYFYSSEFLQLEYFSTCCESNKTLHQQTSICYTEFNLVQNGTKIRFVIPITIAPRYNPYLIQFSFTIE